MRLICLSGRAEAPGCVSHRRCARCGCGVHGLEVRRTARSSSWLSWSFALPQR